MVTLYNLISDIQNKFSEGCPNGFLLEWDVNRFFHALLSLFDGYKVINDTDFNYSYCNSYDVELGEDENNDVFILTLKASFISDAYTIHITRYSSDRRNGVVIPYENCLEYESEIAKVKGFIENEGFVEVQSNEMDVVVENVELELAGPATVGKCLFDDF